MRCDSYLVETLPLNVEGLGFLWFSPLCGFVINVANMA